MKHHLIHICIFITAALIGPILATNIGFFQIFLIYFIAQCTLYGIALFLQWKRLSFMVGVSVGVALTTALEGIWELVIYQGPNSMPLYPYIFTTIPIMLIGIIIASLGLTTNGLDNNKKLFVTGFAFTSPMAWYFMYLIFFK
jgi:hypothetical protein